MFHGRRLLILMIRWRTCTTLLQITNERFTEFTCFYKSKLQLKQGSSAGNRFDVKLIDKP